MRSAIGVHGINIYDCYYSNKRSIGGHAWHITYVIKVNCVSWTKLRSCI